MVGNSLVRCPKCGKEMEVNFANCLQNGWPKCHKLAMTLIATKANIEQSVEAVILEVLEPSAQRSLP
jgi:phage FluMu protein Com